MGAASGQTARVLVAYASRHGATQAIAERIADVLVAAGQEAEARPVEAVGDVSAYDAFVIGSAVYFGSWMKGATAFVRQNRPVFKAAPCLTRPCN